MTSQTRNIIRHCVSEQRFQKPFLRYNFSQQNYKDNNFFFIYIITVSNFVLVQIFMDQGQPRYRPINVCLWTIGLLVLTWVFLEFVQVAVIAYQHYQQLAHKEDLLIVKVNFFL